MKKISIIGGGILGLSLGYKLSKEYKGYEVSIFEKESNIGLHQSGRNSGVLHCGLNYKPKSLKAKLAFNGIREMIDFCKNNNVDYDRCGKVVVATNDNEKKTLDNLAHRGNLNGLNGLKFLNSTQLKLREPHVRGVAALLVPEEGIVDYKGVMKKMSNYIIDSGGKIYFNSKIKSVSDSNTIVCKNGFEEEFDLVVNCSGLYSDITFSNFTNKKRPLRIIPFRGEYMNIKDEYKKIVNHLVYPVPNPKFPFLGVHFTRLVNGAREVGPNAVLALKREGYSNKDISIRDSFDSISYLGLHSFVAKNFRFAVNEFFSSLFLKSFVKKAKKLIPDINEKMIEKGGAGVRAQAMNSNGDLIMDFKIEKYKNQIHVLNAPSPGATASLSIADYIINNYIK